METDKTKKPRGRPSLTPEEKEQRKIENNKRSNEHHKKTGYAAQRKYKKTNDGEFYLIGVTMRKEFESTLDELVAMTGLSPAKLFLSSTEEKYNVILMSELDRKDKK